MIYYRRNDLCLPEAAFLGSVRYSPEVLCLINVTRKWFQQLSLIEQAPCFLETEHLAHSGAMGVEEAAELVLTGGTL